MLSQSTAIDEVLKTAGRKTAILDSNLLVVWISNRMGLAGKIPFKRVRDYSVEDGRLLEWILARFSGVVTTSGVLAETSNLANELSGDLRTRWFRVLANFAVITEEAHVSIKTVGEQDELVRFGFTDTVLACLSSTHVLITAEYRLAGYLKDQGKQVFNFNDLRLLRLLSV